MLFISTTIVSQINEIENLYSDKHDTIKIKLLDSLAWTIIYDNPDSAKKIVSFALKIAPKKNDFIPQLYTTIGEIYSIQSEFDKSFEFQYKALKFARENNLKKSEANTLLNIANLQEYKGKPNLALSYLDTVESIYKKMKNEKGLAQTIVTKGMMYYRLGDYDNAIEKYLSGLQYFEKNKDTIGMIITYSNYGLVLGNIKEHEKALLYLYKAKNLSETVKRDFNVAICLNSIGINLSNLKKYEEAKKAYIKAIEIAEKLGNKSLLIDLFINISDDLLDLAQTDSAIFYLRKGEKLAIETNMQAEIMTIQNGLSKSYLIKNEYKKSIYYAENSLEINKSINEKVNKKLSYEFLFTAYKELNDFENAFKYQQKYYQLADSIFNETKHKQIAELNTKYETEKKEQQIEIQEKENQVQKAEIKAKQRTIWLGLIGIIILVLSGIAFYLQRQKSIRQKHEKQMLKMQVETQEATRQELASSLHSGAGSKLSAIILNLQNKDTENKLSEEIGRLREHYEVIRSKSHILAIPSFIQTTIEDEINDIATTFKTENQNVNCSIFSNKGWKDIHPIIQQTIYRISQELLNNTTKHAGATEIELQIIRHPNYISLMYEDNGKGYNPQEIKQNYGYQKEIIDKIEFIKGSFTDDSLIGQGANLSFKFPLNYEA